MKKIFVPLQLLFWAFRFLFLKFLTFTQDFDKVRQAFLPLLFSHSTPQFHRLLPWLPKWLHFSVLISFWPSPHFGLRVAYLFVLINWSPFHLIGSGPLSQYFFSTWLLPSWVRCFHFLFEKVSQWAPPHLHEKVRPTWIFAGNHWPG